MDELQSLLDEYIDSGLSIDELKQFLKTKISGSKLPSELRGYIRGYIPPKRPSIKNPEELENIKDPQIRASVARNYLLYNPRYENDRYMVNTGILSLPEVTSILLRKDVVLSSYEAGRLYADLIVEGEYDLAEKAYREYPDLYIDPGMVVESISISEFPQEIITHLSKHPSIFVSEYYDWRGIPRSLPEWKENKAFMNTLSIASEMFEQREESEEEENLDTEYSF